jgi:hypothetical protein
MKRVPFPLVLAWLSLTTAHAASTLPPPDNLVACSAMTDPGERLKCYDTQMAAMMAAARSAVPAPSVAAVPAPAPAAPRPDVAATTAPAAPPPVASAPQATAEQKFGEEGLAPVVRDKVDKRQEVLLSTIASIKQARPKLWVIVLANGQIWLQDGTQITMFFRAGYDVRIEKGLLEGDYRMSTTQTGEKNWVKVTRIQ